MSAAVAIDSVPTLYRSMSRDLTDYLEERLGVTVYEEKLSDLLSYLVTSGGPGAPKALVISDAATDAGRLYAYVHSAAHILLGHADRPFATILEPRRTPHGPSIRLDDWQLRQDLDADVLTGAILWGCEDEAWEAIGWDLAPAHDAASRRLALGTVRSISGLLPGHRYRAIQGALLSSSTRRAILRALKIARAAYHRSGVHSVFANEPVIRELREVYCLTELVAVVPELLHPHRRP